MINTVDLTKTFDKYTALDSVTCTIPDSSIYGIVGSNGAGKSTLLRLLTGVYKPDSGSITIDGMPVYNNPDIKANIAMVADELYFLPNASIAKMSKLYQSLYPNYDEEKLKNLAETLKLDTKRSIATFSKGMKRQAATILTLATNAKYMFFDETFDGLDPIVRNYIKGIICSDVLERQATAIITSHSLRELEDACDKLALLHKGGVILQNDVDNIKTSHFKVQVAFPYDYDESLFKDITYQKFSKSGSVSTMLVSGDAEATQAILHSLNPIICDILPLTLEEVFSYELETLEYNFDISFKETEN